MTRDEHKAMISDVLDKASGMDLCDVVVIGIKPSGGLHIDWSGTTVTSLVMHLEAAKFRAVEEFVKALPEAHDEQADPVQADARASEGRR